MGKLIQGIPVSETLYISQCSDGYWLWDKTRQMNLSVKAKSKEDTFVEALHYYQRRLTEVEQKHSILEKQVDAFVSQFMENDDD